MGLSLFSNFSTPSIFSFNLGFTSLSVFISKLDASKCSIILFTSMYTIFPIMYVFKLSVSVHMRTHRFQKLFLICNNVQT